MSLRENWDTDMYAGKTLRENWDTDMNAGKTVLCHREKIVIWKLGEASEETNTDDTLFLDF